MTKADVAVVTGALLLVAALLIFAGPKRPT